MRKLRFLISYPLILLYITLLLFALNYVPGTFLTGWDNMHPEFNLELNWQRNLYSVWQEYRGLGLFDGQAHNANLVHTAFVAILSSLLPLNMIRYVVMFALYYLGGLGMYFFLRKRELPPFVSFTGALFYMFNIGTIQQFFAPLEVFIFHYAYLPWAFLLGFQFVQHKSHKTMLAFALVSILATPQAFIPTVVIALLLSFSAFFANDFIQNRHIARSTILVLVFLAVNSFWLLPYVVSVTQNAGVIKNARINQYSSDVVYEQNRSRGDLMNVLQLKGFMLDYYQYDGLLQRDTLLMDPWTQHLVSPLYSTVFTLFLLLFLVGILVLFRRKKERYLFIPLVIAIFFLGNNTFILRQLNELIRFVPIIGEAFRAPFTKFIFIYAFFYSIFVATGVNWVLRQLVFFRLKQYETITHFALCGALLLLIVPALNGNFFSPLLKREIPKDYFEAFDYFKKEDPNGRVALVPTHTFWSWQHRTWGYGGSDFLWFGIPQPLLSRAFDPWSQYNEQFFNEINTAIEREDSGLFTKVLLKYNVTYILFDKTFINNIAPLPTIDVEKLTAFFGSIFSMYVERTPELLTIKKMKEPLQPVTVYNNLPSVKTNGLYTYEDSVYPTYGTYVTDSKPTAYYPFYSMFTEKLQQDVRFAFEDTEDSIIIASQKGFFAELTKPQQVVVELPATFDEYYIPARVTIAAGKIEFTPLNPTLFVDGKAVEVKTPSYPATSIPASGANRIRLNGEEIEAVNGDIVRLKRYGTNEVTLYSGGKKLSEQELSLTIPAQKALTAQRMVGPDSVVAVAIPKTIQDRAFEDLIKSRQYEVSPLTEDTYTDEGTILLKTKSGGSEIFIFDDKLPYQSSYLFVVEGKQKSGLPVVVFVDDPERQRLITEARIKDGNERHLFVVPRRRELEEGYKFHVIAESSGNQEAEFEVSKLSLYPLPYDYLKQIRLVGKGFNQPGIAAEGVEIVHEVPYLYTIRSIDNGNRALVLNQGYSRGWKAYIVSEDASRRPFLPFLGGKELSEHLIVNNWAQAWKIPENTASRAIVLVFWPQYLQYIGYGIGCAALLLILIGAFNERKLAYGKNHYRHTPLPKHLL